MDHYVERTRGCITAAKLKEFCRCGFCYYQKFVLETPEPKQDFDKDYFIVGRAFDDLVTYGKDDFDTKYTVVTRRGKESETTQLTQGMGKQIEAMFSSYQLNPFFQRQKRKETIKIPYQTLTLSGEFDDVNHNERCIIDVKTTANLATFDPEQHLWQMAYYSFIYELATGERYAVRLEVVDKTLPVSHNACFEFQLSTLQDKRRDIVRALDLLMEAEQTGVYSSPTNWKSMLSCPYYGHEGHGIQDHVYYV